MQPNGRPNGHSSRSEESIPAPHPPGDDLELLTPPELAQLWKVDVPWVRRATRTQGLPFVRLGRYIRFQEGDVQAWLESRKTVSGSKRP